MHADSQAIQSANFTREKTEIGALMLTPSHRADALGAIPKLYHVRLADALRRAGLPEGPAEDAAANDNAEEPRPAANAP